MFGDHGLCGLLEEGAHEKSPKCLGGNLGDFGEFCKGLALLIQTLSPSFLGTFKVQKENPYRSPRSSSLRTELWLQTKGRLKTDFQTTF
ncbi:hypothetical protein NEISICOT_00085 [Neisseria sicca ATCC 29256]|uniref:Uncharacterized protein n=1 Tax=Neisseria sicca ATCC 29256 TaxID=547045 RepID=C6M0Q9_NEISI|nr:hypothetical protein NEISICOT_00085 [Neisseria sicca ATCC 29256]